MIKDTTFTYEQIMEMLDRLVRASGPQSQDFTFALQLVRNNIMSMAIGAHDQHESMERASVGSVKWPLENEARYVLKNSASSQFKAQ